MAMPRKLLVMIFCVVVALHLGLATIFKAWPYTPLFSNGLQIFSSFLAMAACFSAHQRSRGLAHSFWMLVGCGFGIWGISNFFWAYYEVALHMEPPSGSFVRFLFDLQGAFFAMALLLEENENSTYSILESIADFTQLVIVFTLVYLGFYYIPSLQLDSAHALRLETQMEVGEYCTLIALAMLQCLRTRVKQTRVLFGGLALYLAMDMVGAAIAEYHEKI